MTKCICTGSIQPDNYQPVMVDPNCPIHCVPTECKGKHIKIKDGYYCTSHSEDDCNCSHCVPTQKVESPTTITFELIKKDGSEYLFLPTMDWRLITDASDHWILQKITHTGMNSLLPKEK